MIRKYFSLFDSLFIDYMNRYGVMLLRISLAIVFVWFGALKIFGVSPVEMLIKHTYPTYPEPFFITLLGFWEIAIGLGLLFKLFLRVTLFLLWMQMAGIFLGVFLSPSEYFLHNNLLLLSANGEFVVKNFVLVAASIIIGGQVGKFGKKTKV